MKTFQDMSDSELEAENARQGAIRVQARSVQLEITAEMDRRAAERTTDALLAKLSPVERAAFLVKLQRVEPTPVALAGATLAPGE